MSLTRKFLAGIGLEEAKIESIIEAHLDTVDALKDQIKTLQEDNAKLNGVQKELDAMKSGEDYKAKWEKERDAFNAYKADMESKAKLEKVKAAYKGLLQEHNVGAEQIDAILQITDYSGMTLNDDGKFADAEKLGEDIKSKWGGFIVKTSARAAGVPNPPKSAGTPFETMSLSDKMTYANEHPTAPEVRAWLNQK